MAPPQTRFVAAASCIAVFALGNANTCVFHTDVATYDLSVLAGREYALTSTDNAFDYKLSVCHPLKNLAAECRSHAAPSAMDFAAGIQKDRHFGYCFTLGDVRHQQFHAADAHNAGKGLDITYFDGARCSDGRPRELRLHFICAPHHDDSDPPHFVVETPEKCHYNVSWPSRHACPLGWTGSTSNGGAMRFIANAVSTAIWAYEASWVISMVGYIILATYMCVGCTMIAWSGQAEIGWDAIPHKAFWIRYQWLLFPEWLKRTLLALPGADTVLSYVQPACLGVGRVWQAAIVGVRAAVRRYRGMQDGKDKEGEGKKKGTGKGVDSGSPSSASEGVASAVDGDEFEPLSASGPRFTGTVHSRGTAGPSSSSSSSSSSNSSSSSSGGARWSGMSVNTGSSSGALAGAVTSVSTSGGSNTDPVQSPSSSTATASASGSGSHPFMDDGLWTRSASGASASASGETVGIPVSTAPSGRAIGGRRHISTQGGLSAGGSLSGASGGEVSSAIDTVISSFGDDAGMGR